MKDGKKLRIAIIVGTLVTAVLAYSLILTAKPGDAKSAEEKEIETQVQAMHLSCPKCHGDMEYGMPDIPAIFRILR